MDQPKKKRNFHPATFWGKGKDGGLPTDLDELYRLVEELTVTAIDWYLKHKASRARVSMFLRLGAILFTARGGLLSEDVQRRLYRSPGRLEEGLSSTLRALVETRSGLADELLARESSAPLFG